ncbi:hypothetical protein QZH41_020680 [Actinostola sp. cb2023]|nr:hypothetical protein QZH41_020680 [Actinostola sp. cb2023]
MVQQRSHPRTLYASYNIPPSYAYAQPASMPAASPPLPISYGSPYPSYYPATAPTAAAPMAAPMMYLYTSTYPGTQIPHAIPNEDTQPDRNEIFTLKGQNFKNIGCWTDNIGSRAITILEGKHPLLSDSNYKARSNALMKCAETALDKKHKLFALQNGGQCFGQGDQFESYKKYGPSFNCKGNQLIHTAISKRASY